MRITVIGLGYVGLVTAACVADWGNDVVGVDADPSRLDALRDGRLPFHEPGLDALVGATTASGRLRFTSDPVSAVAAADIVVVAVGTHDGNGGWQTETIRACLAQIVPAMTASATLVVRSTLPPDAIALVAGLVDAHRAAAGLAPIAVMLNPEFTREGRAVHDYQNPERVVLGVISDPGRRGESALRELYRSAAAPILVMAGIDAALTKLGANLFLATKISFANELAELCDAFGADVTTVVDGMSYDGRIGGAFLKAGVGFGGSCLPNQVTMTIKTADAVGVQTPLLAAVEAVNDRRRVQVVERASILLGGSLRGRRVALLGLTFKPDTDDLRDAPALDIARGLLAAGASVVAFDPMATARQRSAAMIDGLDVVDAPLAALDGADIAVLVTEWRELLELDWGEVASRMRQRFVIDGRNVLPGEHLASLGFVYSSFGRGTLDPTLDRAVAPKAAIARKASVALGFGKR
jgi:UDPglucose 6-dehydrogenase